MIPESLSINGHDCFQEIEHAKNVSRAKWVCSCGEDVSLAYILFQEAINAK